MTRGMKIFFGIIVVTGLLLYFNIIHFYSDGKQVDAITGIDGIFGSITHKTKYPDDDEESKSSLIGAGITYYYQNFYIGGGIIKQSSESESGEWSYESSQQFMNFNGGYLHKLNESVFLDIGLQYLKGMGETEAELSGDSLDDIDNEETYFSMNVGIRAFFNPKLPK